MAGKSFSNLEEPETSPITVKNDCDEFGGYDCDFVELPADDLLCKICHYPARDPILTECCGQNFCSYCLERYYQSKVINHRSCPYCREEKFETMPDKKTGRYVLNLKVFCPHKLQGCEWVGELRSVEDHVKKNSTNNIGCPFTELQCSNGCGVVMQRRLVEGHLKSECELREVNCEYCNTTGSYQWINSSHQEECPKYPVECPNHCEVGHVTREEMGEHLEECPLAIMECPYAAVGCESVVRRKEQMEHVMRSVGQHVEYNKNAILTTQESLQKRLEAKEQTMVKIAKDLQDTKDKLTENRRELDKVRKNTEENNKTLRGMMQQLKDKLEGTEQSLQHQLKVNVQLQFQIETMAKSTWPLLLDYLASSGNKVIPIVIKLSEFEKLKKTNSCFATTPFYTRDGGYKMCLQVFANGYSWLNRGHVSVHTYLMKGDHDDHLTWPARGTLTVQLLNQISDSNHSEPVKFHFNGSAACCHRVIKETASNSGVWINKFMPHERLSYDADKNCQYLINDCVFLE